MKKIATLLFLLSSYQMVSSQSIEWSRYLGGTESDAANSIQQTTDHGYILAGYTNSNDNQVSGNHGKYDCWITKLDSAGNLEWQTCLGTKTDQLGLSVLQTVDGGYITLTDIGYGKSIMIVKLDAHGAMQWQRILGGYGQETCYSIEQAKDHGYVVAGISTAQVGQSHGGFGDFLVFKLDSAGKLKWHKLFGGSSYEEARSIKPTLDGGYIVAGYTFSSDDDVTGYHGGGDYWLVKLNRDGTLKWEKTYGGSYYDVAFSVCQTRDGGYIVAGETSSNNGDVTGNHTKDQFIYDEWVVKTDSNGHLQWEKAYGGTRSEWARDIHQTSDDGYFIVGSTTSNDGDVSCNHQSGWSQAADAWLIKTDSMGNIEWDKTVGGSNYDIAYSGQQTSDGKYIFAGYTASTDGDVSGRNSYDEDEWVVKLNLQPPSCSDNFEPNNSQANAATLSTDTIVRGIIGPSGDLDWFSFRSTKKRPNIKIDLTNLPDDYNLALADSTGKIIATSSQFGLANEQIIYNNSQVGLYKIRVEGYANTFNSCSCYTLKVSLSTTDLRSANEPAPATINSINVFPNPANDALNIAYAGNSNEMVSIIIHDLTGKIVQKLSTSAVNGNNTIPVKLNNLSAGDYLLEMRSNEGSHFVHFIIQH